MPHRTPVLSVASIETPLGLLLLANDAEGLLHACEFADREARLLLLLRRRSGIAPDALTPADPPPSLASAFERYFAGDPAALDAIAIDMGGTVFQQLVWSALRAIPAGTTQSYAGLAASLGHPRAARAVGAANGANPFEIVVPCHRLVGASGTLTGYAGGLARKHWLLAHEARHARTNTP